MRNAFKKISPPMVTHPHRLILPVMLILLTILFTACTQNPTAPADQKGAEVAGPSAESVPAPEPAPEQPSTPAPTLPQAREKIFEPAGSDPWRDYSFEPASIKTWTNEEGDEILDVWVRIDYKNNPGTAVRDEQQWHIDFRNNRYKVSDSFAYDANGNFCET